MELCSGLRKLVVKPRGGTRWLPATGTPGGAAGGPRRGARPGTGARGGWRGEADPLRNITGLLEPSRGCTQHRHSSGRAHQAQRTQSACQPCVAAECDSGLMARRPLLVHSPCYQSPWLLPSWRLPLARISRDGQISSSMSLCSRITALPCVQVAQSGVNQLSTGRLTSSCGGLGCRWGGRRAVTEVPV